MTASTLESVNHYLHEQLKTIDGWCSPHLWDAIYPLSKLIGPGPIAEIGVFEGKFFAGLARTFQTSAAHPACALDVFELQEFNIDRAGIGKKDIFLNNLKRVGVDNSAVECLTVDSLTLKQRDQDALVDRYGGFKFFSVDGCHEVAHTMHDIEFAMGMTADDGIIAVDDFLNEDWPGVGEAVAKMYLMREFQFVPLLYTSQKLFLCSYSVHKKYIDAVFAYCKNHRPNTRVKIVKRFGYTTLSLRPMREWTPLEEADL